MLTTNKKVGVISQPFKFNVRFVKNQFAGMVWFITFPAKIFGQNLDTHPISALIAVKDFLERNEVGRHEVT